AGATCSARMAAKRGSAVKSSKGFCIRLTSGGVYGAAADDGARDAARELEPLERRVLALARERGRLHDPRTRRIVEADVRAGARRERARGNAQDLRGAVRDAGQRVDRFQSGLLAPLEGEGQEKFEPRGARLRLGEGHLLRVVVDRGMVRTDRVDHAFGKR